METTYQPLFSVVIPAYNAEKYIQATIRSILRQSVGDFEIVVVNDGSTDRTREILESVHDARLRIINQENGGECVARNRGMQEARGKYLAFLDSDDVWHCNHLEQARDFFSANEECVWFCSTQTMVSDISEDDITTINLSAQKIIITNWYLEAAPKVLPSSVCILREAAMAIPHLFQEGFKMFGDNLGWCKFAKIHPMIGLSDTSTVLYRFWQGNASTTHNVYRHGLRTEAVAMALAKHAAFFNDADCPESARLYYRQFALSHWWICITSTLIPRDWDAYLQGNRTLVGLLGTGWIKLLYMAVNGILHLMRWGIRRKKLSILRKMEKLANQTRTTAHSHHE
ncbi:MAG: glycosyltransferase family A protein [Akkermansia sp.]|nr:glycosyltransferase family A protein [Akkermansia sp.]